MSCVRVIIAPMLSFCLYGCISVGETAIYANRTKYNEAINSTSAQQLLLNIVRAGNYETPTFLTLTEVDGTYAASAGVTGGPSMLGAIAGAVGTITGTASISDAPLAKYSNLSGMELIQQVSLPVSMQSIARLETSDWPLTPLLVLTVDRLTPKFIDFYRAVDTIYALYVLGAVTFDSLDQNILYIDFYPNGNVGAKRRVLDDQDDDALRCIAGKVPADVVAAKLWSNLITLFNVAPGTNRIVLGIAAATKTKHLPIYTISAYSALKYAERGDDSTGSSFSFVSPASAKALRDANVATQPTLYKDGNCVTNQFYYYPDPQDQYVGWSDDPNLRDEVKAKWLDHYSLLNSSLTVGNSTSIRALGHRRTYFLIEESSDPIPNTFVSVFKNGKWYGIDNSDVISKKNFQLLNQILTIQAVSSAPTTQTSLAVSPAK